MKYKKNKIKYMISEIIENFELTSNQELLLSKLINDFINIKHSPYIHVNLLKQTATFYCLSMRDGLVLQNFLFDIVLECYEDGLIDFRPNVDFYITRDEDEYMKNQESCRVVIEG